MTTEQIIQRVRELTRPNLAYYNLGVADELATFAPQLADVCEALQAELQAIIAPAEVGGGVVAHLRDKIEDQDRELAQVADERDALKAKLEHEREVIADYILSFREDQKVVQVFDLLARWIREGRHVLKAAK